jgi:circadian clock protein KaiB
MKRRLRANDTTKAFEEALNRPSADHYLLRLYVTGSTPRSARAIRQIRAICETKLQGRFQLEVVDVHQNPTRIKPDQIVVTPTLVKELPLPVRKIVGDLSNVERVLVGLDIRPYPPSGAGM